jgi:hypothetical protein
MLRQHPELRDQRQVYTVNRRRDRKQKAVNCLGGREDCTSRSLSLLSAFCFLFLLNPEPCLLNPAALTPLARNVHDFAVITS